MFRITCSSLPFAAFVLVLAMGYGGAHAQDSRSARVVVDNQGYYDMHIYVLDGSTRRSLGLATGLSRREFTLPDILVDSHRDVRILANAIAGNNDYLSQTLLVGPGDWVTVVLRSNPRLSYTSVSEYDPTPPPREASPDDEPDDEPDAPADSVSD